MQFSKFSITLVCVSLLIFTTESQQPTYLHHVCPNTTTFTTNSTYLDNRDLLLSSLTSNTTLNYNGFYNGFYNATAGSNTTDPLYGLYLCRGDLGTTDCQNCVTFASTDLPQRCPIELQAIVFYDECMLRYSNRSFFSTVDTSTNWLMWNTQNFTNQDDFNALLAATMNDTTTRAYLSPKRFATKEANFTAFQTLYTIAQCTQDLSSSDCNRCFLWAKGNLPLQRGGRVLSPSCIIRYEIYPFYNQSLVAAPPPSVAPPPPPSPPPPAPVTSPKGKAFFLYLAVI